MKFLESLAGKLFYVGMATYGMWYFALAFCGRHIKTMLCGMRNKQKVSWKAYLATFLTLSAILQVGISAVYMAEAGIVDVVADEAEVLSQIRTLVSLLPGNNEDDASYVECTDDLNRASAELANCVGDTSVALSIIADDNMFFESDTEVTFF